jgi:hypothetical protein
VALDWVKLDKTTPDKPEIAILSRLLSISQGDAFLEWARVYIWADGVTEDGFVPFLSLADGDRLSRCRSGTFKALASQEIGWVIPVGNGFRFANWDRHNGKCAKARALDTEKKRNQRGMSRKRPGNCPDTNGTKTGLEKRREEKSSCTKVQEPPWPPGLDSVEFREAWSDWLQHRAEIRKPLKPTAASNKLRQLASWGVERAVVAIRHSIGNGWQGIFEPKGDAVDALGAADVVKRALDSLDDEMHAEEARAKEGKR